MELSLVIPSRNNLQYFQWAYRSIRNNQGDHEVYICAANDASTDGTLEYFERLDYDDPYFKFINNSGSERLGHTILYDRIIDELVETDVFGIFHADMYLCPGAISGAARFLKRKTVVSLTRIEPPIWPPGPEKVIQDFGTEPSEFNEEKFLDWYAGYRKENINKSSDGFFAPWFLYKEDFIGHDAVFRPQSREDSDLGNRFQIKGYEFVQPRDANVYHLTCRGSRRNPTLTNPLKSDSDEWTKQNKRSERNFYRKWGSDIQVSPTLKPVVLPKYNVYGIIRNCNPEGLEILEPHFSKIFVDCDTAEYIKREQKNTLYDLSQRVIDLRYWQDELEEYGILFMLNNQYLTQEEYSLIKNPGLHKNFLEKNLGQTLKLTNIKIHIRDLTEFQLENLDENSINKHRIHG